jgi:hypothetical protein
MVPVWVTVVTGVVGLGVGATVGVAQGSTSGPAAAAAVPSVSVSISVSPSPVVTTVLVPVTEPPDTTDTPDMPVVTTTDSSTIPGDGTYVVGTDIKPGVYRTTGPAPDSGFPNCYWERDRDLNGDFGSIIANDNSQGRTTVQIRATDAAFKTDGCADWVKVG